jgi:sterol desaturase/sphingolipid hydroxylase (fatty acid hydroxylase superfamily)
MVWFSCMDTHSMHHSDSTSYIRTIDYNDILHTILYYTPPALLVRQIAVAVAAAAAVVVMTLA